MELRMNRTEQMMFGLLNMALNEAPITDVCWQSVTGDEWKACYKLAALHGVMALAWDGLRFLPEDVQLPRALRLTWGLAVQDYELKYERYCRTAAELSDFYAAHGIRMVQMKGVGFSSYYPVPSHREGGDIDIYTWSADPNVRSDKEANLLADELMRLQGIEVDYHSGKHSNFYYKGIPVENHKMFLNRETLPVAALMDDLLYQLMNPQLTTLCDGRYQIQTPSKEFNALFIAFHAAQHYGSGIRTHHLFDWACILKRYGWCVPLQVTDERLLDFICALTRLCNRLLGTDVPAKGGEKLEGQVYEELMNPRYPHKEMMPYKNKLSILWYKTKRFVYSYKLKSTIFDVSFFKCFMRSVWFHLRKPVTIFR